MKETKTQNFYEIKIRQGKKIIAHTSCHFVSDEVQIRDLYVLQDYRGKGLGEVLLARVLDYAAEQNASRIVVHCGPEPFCEDGQIPLEQEIAWYEDHGFIHDQDVFGVVPRMVKAIAKEAAS